MQDERILRILTSIQKSYKWCASTAEIIYGRLNCVRMLNDEVLQHGETKSRDALQYNLPTVK